MMMMKEGLDVALGEAPGANPGIEPGIVFYWMLNQLLLQHLPQ
jgi:hypothetical protein